MAPSKVSKLVEGQLKVGKHEFTKKEAQGKLDRLANHASYLTNGTKYSFGNTETARKAGVRSSDIENIEGATVDVQQSK